MCDNIITIHDSPNEVGYQISEGCGELLGGTPLEYRCMLTYSFSELREPILIIFGVLKSRKVVLSVPIFLGVAVTRWYLDPEQF